MHFKKNNNKEVKTYLQGLRPFGNSLPRGLKHTFKKRGFLYFEILTKWKLIVGNRISKISYPKSLKTGNNNDSALILAVERGSEIDIEYSKHQIINKINSFFGYNCISHITLKIVQDAIEVKKKVFPKLKKIAL